MQLTTTKARRSTLLYTIKYEGSCYFRTAHCLRIRGVPTTSLSNREAYLLAAEKLITDLVPYACINSSGAALNLSILPDHITAANFNTLSHVVLLYLCASLS